MEDLQSVGGPESVGGMESVGETYGLDLGDPSHDHSPASTSSPFLPSPSTASSPAKQMEKQGRESWGVKLRDVMEEAEKLGFNPGPNQPTNLKQVTHFKSCIPNNNYLSNFATCPVKMSYPAGGEDVKTELVFGSSEAVYQCIRNFDHKYWPEIARLSNIKDLDELITKEGLVVSAKVLNNLQKKFKPSTGLQQTGYLWKLLSNNPQKKGAVSKTWETARKSLGLEEILPSKEILSLQEQIDLWDRILGAKFDRGTAMRPLLKNGANGKYLIEMSSRGNYDFWTGMFTTDKTDGILKVNGFNFMGKMLMRRREQIVQEDIADMQMMDSKGGK